MPPLDRPTPSAPPPAPSRPNVRFLEIIFRRCGATSGGSRRGREPRRRQNGLVVREAPAAGNGGGLGLCTATPSCSGRQPSSAASAPCSGGPSKRRVQRPRLPAPAKSLPMLPLYSSRSAESANLPSSPSSPQNPPTGQHPLLKLPQMHHQLPPTPSPASSTARL